MAPRRRDVTGPIDALHLSDHFVDLVSQAVWRRDRLVPDRVPPRPEIEMALAIDVDVELESDAAIEAREDHAVRYGPSPDLGARDRLSRVSTSSKTFTCVPLGGGYK